MARTRTSVDGKLPKAEAEAVTAAAEVSEEEDKEKSSPREIRLSSGVVLHLRPVPPFLVRKVASKIERPKVPVVDMPEKGRKEENPSDPDYEAALEEYEEKTFDAGFNLMLARGVDIVSVPEGMSGVDDEGWIEELKDFDIDLEVSSPSARKISWLRLCALTTTIDVMNVSQGLSRLTGMGEEEVESAVSSFRNRETRRANRKPKRKSP